MTGDFLMLSVLSKWPLVRQIRPHGNWIELGSVKQKGGKTVHVWAFAGDLPNAFQLKSNTLELEWPPRSGKLKEFPEVDGAEFFEDEIARRKYILRRHP